MAERAGAAEAAAGARAAPMRWWGWGEEGRAPGLSAGMLELLRERVGVSERPRPPVALANVRLGEPGLTAATAGRLRGIVGGEHVREDHFDRVVHAAGKGYPDLVRVRAGEPEGAPDAVLYPGDHEQVRGVLEECVRAGVAVVPFGGGTSVVGGVAPLRGEHGSVVALDLSRLDALHGLDLESLIVRVGAGLRVRALERRLRQRGLTLGHFPQSYEHVAVGGCAATRSAGQASTGYGRFEDMVLGLRLAAPAGDLVVRAVPASAAGPSLRELVVGSEGTLGVISELELRVREAPERRAFEGAFFGDFAAGVAALRVLAQEGSAPAVTRLSDEGETRLSLAAVGSGEGLAGLKRRLGSLYLGARGYGSGCLAIFGFEGSDAEIERRRGRVAEVVAAHGGLGVGSSPGEAWAKQRFSSPYLRDELLTHGVMVETLETAVRWSGLTGLHRSVAGAIEGALNAQGTPGLVMCHVSHVYETGASLYFTVLARQREGREIEQWEAVKRAAGEAILGGGGGTITHHHAIGRDHVPWMEREVGGKGMAVLRGLKGELDPGGVMNPGKMVG